MIPLVIDCCNSLNAILHAKSHLPCIMLIENSPLEAGSVRRRLQTRELQERNFPSISANIAEGGTAKSGQRMSATAMVVSTLQAVIVT